MTAWMQEAWGLVGQSEIAGAGANPEIVRLFRDAGHGDIASDETAWCAAFVSACLARAGLPHPTGYQALRAAGFETFGQACELRAGAIVVVRARGDGRHVGFCVGMDAHNVMLLGGNQADACNVTPFKRASIVAVRWPAPEASANELKAVGSRTVTGAGAIQRDGAAAAGVQVAPNPFPVAPAEVAGQAREAMGLADTAAEFATFVGGKWPWLMGMLTVYLLARMAWRAGWIKAWRVEDHNTGANQGRAEGNDAAAA